MTANTDGTPTKTSASPVGRTAPGATIGGFPDIFRLGEDPLKRRGSAPVEKIGAIAVVDALGVRQAANAREVLAGLVQAKDTAEAMHAWNQLFQAGVGVLSSLAAGSTVAESKVKPVASTVIGLGDTLIVAAVGEGADTAKLFESVSTSITALFLTGLNHNLTFRGAISVGSWFQLEPPIPGSTHLIGPAITDAVEWYDKADWAGVMLTPRAGLEWERIASTNDGSRTLDFVRYPVPLKEGDPDRLGVVDWALNWPEHALMPRDELLRLLARRPFPKVASRKIANTLRFYDWVTGQKKMKPGS